MKVRGKDYRAVWMDGADVVVINQPLLPHRFALLRLRNHRETAEAIRTMIIRGAGTIGATAGYGLAQACLEAPPRHFVGYIRRAYHTLLVTRPTAADLKHALDRVAARVEKVLRGSPTPQFGRTEGLLLSAKGDLRSHGVRGQETLAQQRGGVRGRSRTRLGMQAETLAQQLSGNQIDEARAVAVAEAEAIADEYVERARRIAAAGLPLIKNGTRVLTHCNAGWLALVDWGSAPAPIYLAHRRGRKVFVWVDETRPRNQGANLTSWEFLQEGVPHKIIADNAGGLLMLRGEVDLCIVGADRIAANGDAANKIGTYQKAVLAHENGVPFYVAAPSSTIDLACRHGDDIPIEERDEAELHYVYGKGRDGRLTRVRISPANSRAANPAFDVTPARYITGIITERGIVRPSQLRQVFGPTPVPMNGLDAIVFDLGNVLLTLDWDRPAQRLSARTGLTRHALADYCARTQWMDRLGVGELGQDEFFEGVAAELGFTGSYAEFAVLWSDMFIPNDPMIALAQRLKGRLPRLILSNTNAIHMRYVFSRYAFMDEFDGYVFSHEVGVSKPDARIYERLLRRHRLAAARTVFLDDLAENVAGARAVGLQAIHYQTAAQAHQELTNLGLSPI